MADPNAAIPAPVLGRQLRIPNLFLKRADDQADLRAWAAELSSLAPHPAASIAVPTRHGATLVEIHEAYRALGPGSKARRARLIAASTKMGNPIVWSLAKGEETCVDLGENEVWPSEISEVLSTHHAKQGDAAVAAVRATNGWGYAASDNELQGLSKHLERTEGIRVAPAATAGIAALHFAAKLGKLESDGAHVAVIYLRSEQGKIENGGPVETVQPPE